MKKLTTKAMKITSVVIVMVILLSLGIGAAVVIDGFEYTVSDITEDDWYCDDVIEGYKKAITKGAEYNQFFPNDNITREEFITMLMRISDGQHIPSDGNRFKDVPFERWSSGAVSLADDRGIVKGISENYFGAHEMITREAIATMIYRWLKYRSIDIAEGTDDAAPFSDADLTSDWAWEAVLLMSKTGIINGYSDGTFRPQDFATRAEAVSVLVRLMNEIGFKNIFDIKPENVSKIVINTDPVRYTGEHGQVLYNYTKTEITDPQEVKLIFDGFSALESLDSYLFNPKSQQTVGGSIPAKSIVFYGANGEKLLVLIFKSSADACSLEENNVQEYIFAPGALDFVLDYVK